MRYGEALVIHDVFVDFHPGGGVVATAKSPRWQTAVRGEFVLKRINPDGGQLKLRQINPVVHINGVHVRGRRSFGGLGKLTGLGLVLFRHGVGQGLQRQRCAIGRFEVQGMRVRGFNLHHGQHVESAAGRGRGVDDGAGGLAVKVGAE